MNRIFSATHEKCILRPLRSTSVQHAIETFFFLSAALRTGVDEAKLVILPPLNGDSGTKMVVKSGSKFTVSCIYDHPELSSDKIHWRNEHGKEIDGESSAR